MVPTRPAASPNLAAFLAPALAGMVVLVMANTVGNGQSQLAVSRGNEAELPQQPCEAILRNDAQISRDQLANLLTIPERDSKEAVRKVVNEPYCRLPALQVRSGVTSEREAYPLAFDPTTYLVILYEGDEYAGYRFKFQ